MIEKNDARSVSRRERRRLIEGRDTQLRRLSRESDRLSRVRSDAPLIELDEPFQRGWVRSFQLKPDAARRADANRLREAVSLVECRQYCRTGKWMAWSLKRRRMLPMRHEPKCFTPGELLRKRPPRELLKYFATEHHGLKVTSYDELLWLHRRSYGGRLQFIYPQFLEAVTEPYMITHQRAHFPDIERRIDEIDHKMEGDGEMRLLWLNGLRCYRNWGRHCRTAATEKAAKQDLGDQLRDSLEPPEPSQQAMAIAPSEAGKGAGDRAFFVSPTRDFSEAA